MVAGEEAGVAAVVEAEGVEVGEVEEEGEGLAVTELASGGRLSAAVSQLVAGVGQLSSHLSPGHGQSDGLVVSGNFRAIFCCVLGFFFICLFIKDFIRSISLCL